MKTFFGVGFRIALLIFITGSGIFPLLDASAQPRGILNRPAPEWELDEWFNLPEDKKELKLEDLRGKVIYLYGFQSWCPGCIQYGFPALQKVSKHYKENKNVAFVAVQTVFEGFGTNTLDRAKQTLKRFDLDIPAAHDAGKNQSGSSLLKKYRTGGTPWTIIIDTQGIVRFNDFHIEPESAIQTIDSLLDQAGLIHHRVGEPFKSAEALQWLNTEQPFSFKDSKLTLMRWFTDGCPDCISSVPALQELAGHFPKDELRFVAVYHPQPVSKPIDPQWVKTVSRQLGIKDIVAMDESWSALQREWLDAGNHGDTDITFVIDDQGIIRYAHSGPRIFHSINPANRQANQDMLELEKTIHSLLVP